MPANVAQPLRHHLESFGGKPVIYANVAVAQDLHGNAREGRESRCETLHRRGEAAFVLCFPPQTGQATAQVTDPYPRHFHKRVDVITHAAAGAQFRTYGGQPHLKPDIGLENAVVKVARDRLPLLLGRIGSKLVYEPDIVDDRSDLFDHMKNEKGVRLPERAPAARGKVQPANRLVAVKERHGDERLGIEQARETNHLGGELDSLPARGVECPTVSEPKKRRAGKDDGLMRLRDGDAQRQLLVDNLGLYGCLRVRAGGAAERIPLRFLRKKHDQAVVGVVEQTQSFHRHSDGSAGPETRIRDRHDFLQERKPALQVDFESSPSRNHVADNEEERGTQQEAVELDGGRSRKTSDNRERQRRGYRNPNSRPETPPEAGDHDCEIEAEKEDTVRAAAQGNQQAVPPQVQPVRPGSKGSHGLCLAQRKNVNR